MNRWCRRGAASPTPNDDRVLGHDVAMHARTPISPEHHDAIECATLSAVAPEHVELYHGWLVPYDGGTVGRAKSAAPLWQADGSAATLSALSARYAAAGITPTLRLSDHAHFAPLVHLAPSVGWCATRPTQVQVANPDDVRWLATDDGKARPLGHMVRLDDQASAAWQAVYLGAGFDAVDGASRVRCLVRSADASHHLPALAVAAPQSISRGKTWFASVIDERGTTCAVGAAHLFAGWLGIHGMRTLPQARRQGLATQLIRAMAEVAVREQAQGMFLQVEEDNTSAQAVYARLGFATGWRYAYWHHQGA